MPRSLLVLPLVLILDLTACGGPEIVCTMPDLPSQGASETEWSLYRGELDVYKQCMAGKARRGATVALDKVDSAADTTKSWVNKARSHL